jgi:hypothetical protein
MLALSWQFLFAPSPEARWMALLGCTALAGIGGALWLMGVRFSRPLVCLVMVLAGAAAGLRLPGHLGFAAGSWATSIGGALVLGVAGYALHHWLVALGLMLMSAVVAGAGLILLRPVDFESPARIARSISTWSQLKEVWQSIPQQSSHAMMLTVGAGAVAGLAAGIFFKRLTGALFYSMLGMGMMVGFGVGAANLGRPTILNAIPPGPGTRLALIIGLVLFGTAVQWRMNFSKRVSKKKTRESESKKE